MSVGQTLLVPLMLGLAGALPDFINSAHACARFAAHQTAIDLSLASGCKPSSG